MADEVRIAVGDYVRLNPETVANQHPRATEADIGQHTMAYVVTAYDKDTDICTLSRQGQVFGEYATSSLIKVEAPPDNTKPAPPVEPPPEAPEPAKTPFSPFAPSGGSS